MVTYVRPIFVSEEADPDHTLTDCVWTAGLMEANAAQGGIHPATLAEAELLENAAGGPFPLGSTSQELVAGTTKRYGWAATIEGTPAAILSALQPGRGATVSGKPGLLPDTTERPEQLRQLFRWQPCTGVLDADAYAACRAFV